MKVLLLPLLLVLSLLQPTGSSELSPEDHSPIVIDDPTDLVLPDAISGNGVRGGTGTPLDPFRIESWTIRLPPTQGTGIVIRGISQHIAINHVTVIGAVGRADNATGVVIRSSINVSIQDLRVEGLWRGVAVSGSSVVVKDVSLAGPQPAPPRETNIPDPYNFPRPSLLDVAGSTVDLDSFDLHGSTTGINWGYSRGTVRNGRIANVTEGIHVYGYEHMGLFSDLAVTKVDLKGSACRDRHGTEDGISVLTESVFGFTLADSSIRCFGYGLSIGGTGPPAGPLTVSGTTFAENRYGLVVNTIANATRIEGNDVSRNAVGIRLALDTAKVRTAGWLQGNTWTKNGVAIQAYHSYCPKEYDCTTEYLDQSRTPWSMPPAPGEWVVSGNSFRGNQKSIEYDTDHRPIAIPHGYRLNANGNDWPGCGAPRSGHDRIVGPVNATDSGGPCKREAGRLSGFALLLPLSLACWARRRSSTALEPSTGFISGFR